MAIRGRPRSRPSVSRAGRRRSGDDRRAAEGTRHAAAGERGRPDLDRACPGGPGALRAGLPLERPGGPARPAEGPRAVTSAACTTGGRVKTVQCRAVARAGPAMHRTTAGAWPSVATPPLRERYQSDRTRTPTVTVDRSVVAIHSVSGFPTGRRSPPERRDRRGRHTPSTASRWCCRRSSRSSPTQRQGFFARIPCS